MLLHRGRLSSIESDARIELPQPGIMLLLNRAKPLDRRGPSVLDPPPRRSAPRSVRPPAANGMMIFIAADCCPARVPAMRRRSGKRSTGHLCHATRYCEPKSVPSSQSSRWWRGAVRNAVLSTDTHGRSVYFGHRATDVAPLRCSASRRGAPETRSDAPLARVLRTSSGLGDYRNVRSKQLPAPPRPPLCR